MIRLAASVALGLVVVALRAATTDVPIHDPSIIRQNGTYYVFGTGPGIVVWSSPDRIAWTRQPPVFAAPPAWTQHAVPTFRGMFWAPDIVKVKDRFYLYYAVSAFGKNTSAIGVATNATLDRSDRRFRWEDHGKVIQSYPGVTNWNAIDPNLFFAEDGSPHLAFGSFWSGLKTVPLTADLFRPSTTATDLPTLASRTVDPAALNPPAPAGNPVEAGGNSIEAAFVYRHGGYYYLFASIDYCCRGPKSTYKMIVGRSVRALGPYLDEGGRELSRGGGTLLLAGDSRWYGVGHNSVARFDGVDYICFHGYDAAAEGRSKLRIAPLRWTAAEWPVVAVP